MPVSRTYLCTDCNAEFTHFHMSREEPAPDCPKCTAATTSIPGMFSIKTNISRALDFTQKSLEETYGYTDMQDNLRAGDIAAPKPTTMSRQDQEQFVHLMQNQYETAHMPIAPPAQPGGPSGEMNWGGGGSTTMAGSEAVVQAALAQAPSTASHGLDAVSMVEKAKASGQGRMKLNVVGAAKVE